MRQRILFPILAAVATITLAVGVGAAKAAEIETNFGALTPSSGTCSLSTNSLDAGLVCTSPLGFLNNATNFTATGYSDQFATQTALTLKPLAPAGPPSNTLEESGLGENAAGATACTDTFVAINCEIAGPAAVAVVADKLMDDAIIGSVQSGENFQFFTGSSIATLSPFDGVMVGGTCTPGPAAETCLITGFSALAVGVQSASTGNVLLVAVSQSTPRPPIPEPTSLVLIGTALAGLGFAGLWRRLGNPAAA